MVGSVPQSFLDPPVHNRRGDLPPRWRCRGQARRSWSPRGSGRRKIETRAIADERIPENLCAWFDALEEQYQAEKRLWQLFTAGDRSPRTGRMYVQFTKALLAGGMGAG
jgi:hypothetical protein